MQTFLPYASFQASAKILDRRRLGKQRVECLQLLQAALNPLAKGWRHHPACKMWASHLPALCQYGKAICQEWLARGYKDTCLQKICQIEDQLLANGWQTACPPWLGNEAFHDSHKSNLLRKDMLYYGKYGWTVPPTLAYVWPV